ncbi:MAG: AAA family ATPase, partial [Anaerolineae bacterium]|nr:AAA family ATPase [Anaerolineae bacterium]
MSIQDLQALFQRLRAEADKVLVGLEEPFELLIVALLTGGHVLLEGVPGTAKTLMAKTVALLVQADFGRVQFTPDLMPSDILGTSGFDISTGQFNLKKGPIFTQILLADEINRAPAKTQSALLETMEERQVTLEGERHVLAPPFMVIATQNPIEYEGTYPLPEAQLDRFLFKIVVPYASTETEVEILRRYHQGFDAHKLEESGLQPLLSSRAIAEVQALIKRVIVEEGILTYIAQIAA